jgi:hypothetical protein
MANRFLDTNYYKSPFVRSLKGALKSLYSFIICDCDGAGIWNLDLQAASMYIGFEVTQKEFEDCFTAKGKAISLGGDKFFFPDFIEHQYPGGLQSNNKAHKNFIITLKRYGIIDEDLSVKIERLGRGLEAPLKASHVQSLSSNGNGQVNRGVVFFNAEEEVLKNQIEMERICMATGKKIEQAKESLHKYHLYLEDKEQYPKTRKSIFAGFEKWLMNEKNFKTGNETSDGKKKMVI